MSYSSGEHKVPHIALPLVGMLDIILHVAKALEWTLEGHSYGLVPDCEYRVGDIHCPVFDRDCSVEYTHDQDIDCLVDTIHD